MEKELFIAIDANAIIHRAFHAYPPTLTTSDGVQVNAVFGFASMLLKILESYDPKYIVCAFDTAKPTFRHVQFTDYKAHRKPTDESLIAQFPLVEELLTAFNIPIIKKEGFEADDILGTFAKTVQSGKWASSPVDLVIVSGDRDLLQLVGDRVKVALPSNGTFKSLTAFNRDDVKNNYGYYPEQVVDYKAIVGDTSDNIPGVKGVGDKSVLEWLGKYGSLDEIYKNISELKPRYQKLMVEGVEQAQMSKELATIATDVDINLSLESCLLKDFDRNKVVEIFTRFEFRSLITKIPSSLKVNEIKSQEQGQFSLFGEEVSQESLRGVDLVEASEIDFSTATKQVICYITKSESYSGESFLVGGTVDNSGQLTAFKSDTKSFTPQTICETYFYGFEDFCVENNNVESFDTVIDIQVMANLLSSGKRSYSLSGLAFDYLSDVIPEKFDYNSASAMLSKIIEIGEKLKKEAESILNDPYVEAKINEVVKVLGYEADKNPPMINILRRLELPTCKILCEMEKRGILINKSKLLALKGELVKDISEIEANIYKEVGHEFNINSPKQVAEVLFDELKLMPAGMRVRSTKESVLDSLRGTHPVVQLILDYRETSKVLSTYVQPFEEIVLQREREGRELSINTDYKLLGASSGRFASINPNMQNIPARGKWAAKVRELFYARSGYKLAGLDYSQIEFRIMADISGDEALIKDFVDGRDIHRSTAARVFGKSEDEVKSDERSVGKTINFGILYGQTKYGLAKMLGISKDEAQIYIENYFRTYSGVAKYVEHATNVARKRGYVESMFGRRRYVPGLQSRNRQMYEAAVREAINMPIQGGDADIMKLAMVKLFELCNSKYQGKAFMTLQIHDEIVFEVQEGVVEQFASEAKAIMEGIIKLKVPLKVSSNIGETLAELKD